MQGEYARHDDGWASRAVSDIVALNNERGAKSDVEGNARRKETDGE